MAGGAALTAPVGHLYWWTSTAVLAVLSLINLVSIIRRQLMVRRGPSRNKCWQALPNNADERGQTLLEGIREKRNLLSRSSRAARYSAALGSLVDRTILLASIPVPSLSLLLRRNITKIPVVEVFWTTVYASGVFCLSLYGTSWNARTVAGQAAWVAVAQIPMIVGLAGKNNLISLLTGIGYEKLNFLHRAAGRTCLAGVWIHTLGHIIPNRGISLASWRAPITQWGFVGLLALTLVFVTSLGWVRRRLYEFFLVAHISLIALSLAAFILHWPAVSVWVYPGIGLWAMDRILRISRLVLMNSLAAKPNVLLAPQAHMPTQATLTLLSPSTLRLTFPAPRFRWAAGQHFYVVMPGMSRLPWEAHPFTAVTIPESGELSFVLRVRDGFTARMRETLDKEGYGFGWMQKVGSMRVKAAVEGPYGIARSLKHFDGVLLFAGGSGISFAAAHLLQIIQEAKQGSTRVRMVKVVWMLRSPQHLDWIAPLITPHLHSLPEGLSIALYLHVTERGPVLPQMMSLSGGLGITVPRMDSATSWATWTEDASQAPSGETRKRFDSDAQGKSETGPTTLTSNSRPQVESKRGVAAPELYAGRSLVPLERLSSTEPAITRGDIPRLTTSMFRWSDGTAYSQPPQTPLVFQLHDIAAPVRTVSHAPPSVHEPDARQSYFAAPETFTWESRPVSMVSAQHDDEDRTPRPTPLDIMRCPSPFDYWETEYTKATMRLVNPSRSSSRLSLLPLADRARPAYRSQAEPVNERPPTQVSERDCPPIGNRNPSRLSLDPFSDCHASSAESIPPEYHSHSQHDPPPRTSAASPTSAPVPTPMSLPDFGSSLKPFLHWHTGRADIRATIAQAQAEVEIGTISVGVCGPQGLIEAVREQVRTMIGAKQSLRGEVGLDFYAESFGW